MITYRYLEGKYWYDIHDDTCSRCCLKYIVVIIVDNIVDIVVDTIVFMTAEKLQTLL